MAKIVLGFAGQAIGFAIGGPVGELIGGFIGSVLGSMLDNVLFPTNVVGPKLTDLSVTTSTYGKPIPVIYGPENRLGGNVIWSTGLVQKSHETSTKGGTAVNTTTFTYSVTLAVLIGEGVLANIKKIWANGKVIFDSTQQSGASAPTVEMNSDGDVQSIHWAPDTKTHAVFAGLTFYPGTQEQMPDPIIEAAMGVGETPAYRGSAYVVIDTLQLADYGNRLPNLEFLIEAQEIIDVRAIITDIVRRCGIDPNTVSTSSAGGLVRGFAVGAPASGVASLQPLALAYNFDLGEEAGGLRATSRKSAALGVVLADDLAGYASTDDRPEPIRYTRARETTLPQESVVSYSDPAMDYQTNSQRAARVGGSAQNNLSTQVAITMTADDAQALADRTLYEAWTARQTATGLTDDRWIGLQCGRSFLFQTPAGLEPMRITRKTRGANGVISFDIVRDSKILYASDNIGSPPNIPANVLELPGLSELILLDIPLLLDADDTNKRSGFYWGVIGSGPGWRGADVLRALGVGGPYSEIEPQGRELTAGDVVGTMPDVGTTAESDGVIWDETTVLTVTLRRPDMTLSSIGEEEVIDGGNAAYVGAANGEGGLGEIIQFRNADLTSTPGVYELSGLIRGARGTEFTTSLHVGGELFVLLEQGAVKRADFGFPDVGLERAYKAVSLLTLETDADAVLFTNTDVAARPYSPVDLMAEGLSSGDVDLSWVRRSRIGEGVIPPPLGEDSEAYQLEILNGGGATIRTVALTAPAFVYTAAMQVIDFGGAVTTLRWKVAQVSASYGPGIYQELDGAV